MTENESCQREHGDEQGKSSVNSLVGADHHEHDQEPHAHDDAAAPFSAAEIERLHQADRGAAREIVLLITGIFLIGVCLYSIVDWYVLTT